MAQRTLNDYQTKTNSTYDGPTFFSLKNDGDSALVRIMHDTPESITPFDTHKVPTPKFKFGRTVNCLRTPEEPIDNCPLCKAGHKLTTKIFVKMIEYVKQEDGTIKAVPKIWEKPLGFAWELTGKMKIYGPLSQSLFIITRHTPNPSDPKNTTYSMDCAPAHMYPLEAYPNHPELFEGFNVVGHGLYSPSHEDMEYYLVNGDFPTKAQTATESAPSAPQTVAQPQPVPQVTPVATQPQAPWDAESPFSQPATAQTVTQPAYAQPVAQPAYAQPQHIDGIPQQTAPIQRPTRPY